MKKFFLLLIPYTLYLSSSFAQGTWTQKANFGGAGRGAAVGFSIGAKGYIGTGQQPFPNNYNDFWEWDQATNAWTQKADYGGGTQHNAVGFSIGTKGYIGTGYSAFGDFWEWDQATNVWTQKANFGGGGGTREFAVGFSIGKKGYIGTGNNFSSAGYNDFWEWDGDTASPAYNTWTQKANFAGTARHSAVGFSIGSKGYIGTGYDSSGYFKSDFWEWDGDTASPSYNTWTQKANFGGGARAYAVGFSIPQNGKGYIGTGTDSIAGYSNFWEWDQANNLWTQKASYNGGARTHAVGFSIGSMGYIGTGFIANGTKDFWEYCDTCTVGISELNNELSISVFPNPSNGIFNLNADPSTTLRMTNIEIYNVQGENVYSSSQMANAIDLSEQQAGVYFVSVKTEEGILTKKIIVQR